MEGRAEWISCLVVGLDVKCDRKQEFRDHSEVWGLGSSKDGQPSAKSPKTRSERWRER